MKQKKNLLLIVAVAGILIAPGLTDTAMAQTPWSQGTGTVYLTTATDLVGIGVALPTYNLDVQSSAACTARILSTANCAVSALIPTLTHPLLSEIS